VRHLIFVGVFVAAVGVAGQAQAPRPASRAAAAATVTFAKDVAPILYSNCISCHRPGEVAPMSLRTYDEVRPWARSIKQKVQSRQMPPWFADPAHGSFKNDARLTDTQIDTIVKWVDAGAPRGNAADEPKPPALTEGWQLGEPDYVITLPTIDVPAAGKDIFPTPNLTIDIPEDRWIRALEIRPSNREVTHHTVLFLAGANVGQSGFIDLLGVWAVGTNATVYPEGVGRWIRKGQQLRTNLHYHPNGKAQTDTTRVGLYFGRGELKKEVASAVAGDMAFRIPAGAKNHEMRALFPIDQDINIVSYFPHMHFRGKDMTLTALLPDGKKQTLLSVPSYDFNWQLYYYPTAPVPLPKGTIVEAVAHYDNSADNPNNPDPTRDVTFGEQTNDEMMFGVFDFTPKDGVSPAPSSVDRRMEVLAGTLGDAAYLTSVTVLKPIPAVLHIPRTGEGAFYLGQGRFQINRIPIKAIAWTGDNFEFRMDARFGPNAAFTFDVKGTVAPDGTVRGEVMPVGVAKAPFSRNFEGRSARNLLQR
jgi:mono/diheme cytochrome c family protein